MMRTIPLSTIAFSFWKPFPGWPRRKPKTDAEADASCKKGAHFPREVVTTKIVCSQCGHILARETRVVR